MIADTADIALRMVAEVIKFGAEPDYARIESPEEIDTILRARPWDLVVGVWGDPTFARKSAEIALHDPRPLDAISVLNYRQPSVLTLVAGHNPERAGQAGRLSAAICRIFQPLPAEPQTRPGVPSRETRIDCESVLVGMRSALQRAAGPGLAVTVTVTSVSNTISLRRRQFEALCMKVAAHLSDQAKFTPALLAITMSRTGDGPPVLKIEFRVRRGDDDPSELPEYRGVESDDQATSAGLRNAFELTKLGGGRIAVRDSSVQPGVVLELPAVECPRSERSNR